MTTIMAFNRGGMLEQLRISAKEIADLVEGEIEGDPSVEIHGFAPIDHSKQGDLTFVAHPRFLGQLDKVPAAAVLIESKHQTPSTIDPTLIRVSNPYFAFVQVINKYLQAPPEFSRIDPTSQIGKNVEIGNAVTIGPMTIIQDNCKIADRVQIGAHCYIGRRTRIGADSVLFSNVNIAHDVIIGRNVIIQYGTVIGSDGFGYIRHQDRYHKIPHQGRVVIEDEVEIGANCCVDRGTFGDTLIRKGVKLDNLIHVAHNVEIGENTVIAAQTGISGSTKIGREVTIAGQVGFVGHIDIGDRSIFGAQAGVTKSIRANTTVSGYPARDHAKARREEAAIRRLPELLKRVRALEQLLQKNGAPE